MIRLFLSGANGKMGRVIQDLVQQSSDYCLVGGLDRQEDPDFPLYAQAASVSVDFDCLIDFSHPSFVDEVITLIANKQCPAVIATTGLSKAQQEKIRQLSQTVPIFQSANFSMGINLLIELAKSCASVVYPDFNIEIIEAHHRHKVDAPSGTAYLIAHEIQSHVNPTPTLCTDRSQSSQPRACEEIGLSAIRGGSIVGEHEIWFAGHQEVIKLSHQAQSRDVFAQGALKASAFLVNQPPGLYSMTDLLRLKRS